MSKVVYIDKDGSVVPSNQMNDKGVYKQAMAVFNLGEDGEIEVPSMVPVMRAKATVLELGMIVKMENEQPIHQAMTRSDTKGHLAVNNVSTTSSMSPTTKLKALMAANVENKPTRVASLPRAQYAIGQRESKAQSITTIIDTRSEMNSISYELAMKAKLPIVASNAISHAYRGTSVQFEGETVDYLWISGYQQLVHLFVMPLGRAMEQLLLWNALRYRYQTHLRA